MKEVGFLANIQTNNQKEAKNENLDKWIGILNVLCKKFSNNFEAIKTLELTEQNLNNNINESKNAGTQIANILEYVKYYSQMNGIDLQSYLEQTNASAYVLNLISPKSKKTMSNDTLTK